MSTRWVLIVLESILFLSIYMPHTRRDEAKLEDYYKTLNAVDENIQEVKQKFYISGITAGMDAQVEVKPHQEPFVGGEKESRKGENIFAKWEAKFKDTSWNGSRSTCEHVLRPTGTHWSRNESL